MMVELDSRLDGGQGEKGWVAKRLSGAGEERSAVSQDRQASAAVACKPNELLAESAGESGDGGEAAESDAKSVQKASVSKRESGEKSG